jgi:PAS domain S-box-containing protein
MFSLQKGFLKRPWVRYGIAVVAVAVGFGLRRMLTVHVGEALPTYITFYPAVMVAALLAGLGPGFLATVLTVVVVDYWISSPKDLFVHASPAEAAGAVLFSCMGVFLSVLTELYRRAREQAAAYEKELALRESEQALRESESFYRQTLESIPGMIFTTRPDGSCDYQSQQWVDYTGIPMSEHLGDGWNKLLHPDDRPRAFAAWRDAVEDRAPYDLEYRVRRHDGTYEWFKVRGRPIRDAAGKIVRWFGTALNIEGLKRAEERLKASLREKEVLLQEIHHRVKNNLQVISSLINLQADALDQPALRASLNDVRDRVRTMALVHEKLYQSGDLGRLNFADYAASLLHYLWRAHGDAAAKVRLTLATQPVTFPVGIAVPCGLILNELASNALKHAFRGRTEGEVTVGLEREAATNRLCLYVSDNGVGLPADLDVRRSASLGLRLVQMLTQQIGGTVAVRRGPGTEFRVAFAAPEGA